MFPRHVEHFWFQGGQAHKRRRTITRSEKSVSWDAFFLFAFCFISVRRLPQFVVWIPFGLVVWGSCRRYMGRHPPTTKPPIQTTNYWWLLRNILHVCLLWFRGKSPTQVLTCIFLLPFQRQQRIRGKLIRCSRTRTWSSPMTGVSSFHNACPFRARGPGNVRRFARMSEVTECFRGTTWENMNAPF